jgi:type VI secretion system protein ImpC
MNEILHAPEVREMEGTWRGLHYLVNNTETDQKLKIRVLNISKGELADTLEDYEGQMWDQSPAFKKIYTDEYSMFGGEPFGCLIGAYEFSHHPKDVGMLRNMSGVCASAHAPFIAAAAPQLFRMDSWQELPNPQDLQQIVSSPDYASWQSLRESEDARYIGLTMPRVLARLPYGANTVPVKGFAFEEEVDGEARPLRLDERRLRDGRQHQPQPQALSAGARRSAGVESGRHRGQPSGAHLPDRRRIGGDEMPHRDRHRRPARGGTGQARPDADPAPQEHRHRRLHRRAFAAGRRDARRPAGRSRRPGERAAEREPALPVPGLPLRALSQGDRARQGRHVQGAQRHAEVADRMDQPLRAANPAGADDKAKARVRSPPAEVQVDSVEGRPGYYNARFYLRPHYQLEGINASLRLVSELPSVKGS